MATRPSNDEDRKGQKKHRRRDIAASSHLRLGREIRLVLGGRRLMALKILRSRRCTVARGIYNTVGLPVLDDYVTPVNNLALM